MAKNATGTPTWNEERKHWRLTVANEGGQRKSFYSSDPSQRKGPAECRRKAQEWLDDWDAPAEIKFEKAWTQYLEYYARKNRPTSANVYESRGKAHLLPALKGRILCNITKREWQSIITDAYDNGAHALKTLNGIATTIRTFCKWAASKGYVRDQAVPVYFDYPIGAGKKQKSILQPDQLGLLFSPDEDDASWYMPMWRFLMLTGLRRGELCALQRLRDYDAKTRMLTVRESISHEGLCTDGKTKNAERTIYLADLALAQLEAHRDAQAAQGVKVGKYLFTDPSGRRISPRALRNHWQSWREEHGIDLTLHELRHTFISYSRIKTEISLEDLKQLYGHAQNMDTDRTYVHAIDKSPEEVIAEREKKRAESITIDTTFFDIIKQSLDKKGTV